MGEYTEADFATDAELVKAAITEANETGELAEVKSGSLDLAERIDRMYIEGRRFWVDTTKPKKRKRGRPIEPDSLNSFAAYVNKQGICTSSHAKRLEWAHRLVTERFTEPRGSVIRPEVEYQVRPLVAVANTPGHEYAVESVWAEAVKAAGGRQPTRKQVQAARVAYFKERGLNTKGQPISTIKPERTKQPSPKERTKALIDEARRSVVALHDEDRVAFLDFVSAMVSLVESEEQQTRERMRGQLSVIKSRNDGEAS